MTKSLLPLFVGTALLASAAAPTPVTTIALGPQPPFSSAARIAVNPAVNRIYVLNSTSIAIVDSSTAASKGTLQPALPAGSSLVAAAETRNAVKGYAVNPSSGRLYVAYANATGSTVVAVDGATDAIAASANVAGAIVSIAINPSTNKLYAIAGSQLLSFDGTTLAPIAAISNVESGALAVNPANNKVYVGAAGGSFAVAVIDSASDAVVAVAPVGADVYDLAVDPVTNNVYSKPNATAAILDLNVYEIDGASNKLAATIPSPFGAAAGYGANFDFVDAVHDVIYSGPIAIDGASDATHQGLPAFEYTLGPTAPLTCQFLQSPVVDFALGNMYGGCDGAIAVADLASGIIRTLVPTNYVISWVQLVVNPVNHAVYGIDGTSVTIVDPIALSSTQAELGNFAGGVAANPLTNQVYITDESSSAAVILDGASNAVTGKIFAQIGGLMNAAFQPRVPVSIAINKAKSQYIVLGGSSGMIFDGVSNAPVIPIRPQLLQANGLAAPLGFLFPSVNETTNKLYSTDNVNIFVTDLNTGTVQVLATPQTKIGEICTVRGLAINAAQNRVYASSVCQSASPVLFVVDATTGTAIQTVDLGAQIPLGANVGDVLYNSKSNKLYVANYGGFNVPTLTGVNPSTEVYSAANFAHLASIPNVAGPMAVDTVLNAIYGLSNSQALSGVGIAGAVIDGNTDTLSSTFPLGFAISAIQPVPIAANEATGMVYYVNSSNGTVSVFQGSLPSPGTFSVSGQLSGPAAAGVTITAQGGVTATAITSASGAFTIAGLPPGVYTISPSAPGAFFSPLSQSVNITTASLTGVNFATLTSPIAITSFTLSPWSTIASGVTTSAIVTLNQPAPSGGVAVTLTSTNTKLIKLPASVTVPAGSTSASLSIQASGSNTVTPVTIGATYQGPLALQPSFGSVVLTVSPGDTLHIRSATFSKSAQLLTVTATSTNAQSILQVFLSAGNQLLGTMVNQGGGNYTLQIPITRGTPASVNVKSNLGGSTGQGVTAVP